MRFRETEIKDVILVEPDIFPDERGYFCETYHEPRYVEGGIGLHFVQDNESQSHRGVLRGLHYQLNRPQGKLVRVIRGEIFDVAVDIRRGSPNFGKWVGTNLSGENKLQLYIPPGFAHGYCVLSETAVFAYKCTDIYVHEDERGIRYDDPELGIDWPIREPIISEKDSLSPLLVDAEFPEFLPNS